MMVDGEREPENACRATRLARDFGAKFKSKIAR